MGKQNMNLPIALGVLCVILAFAYEFMYHDRNSALMYAIAAVTDFAILGFRMRNQKQSK